MPLKLGQLCHMNQLTPNQYLLGANDYHGLWQVATDSIVALSFTLYKRKLESVAS